MNEHEQESNPQIPTQLIPVTLIIKLSMHLSLNYKNQSSVKNCLFKIILKINLVSIIFKIYDKTIFFITYIENITLSIL